MNQQSSAIACHCPVFDSFSMLVDNRQLMLRIVDYPSPFLLKLEFFLLGRLKCRLSFEFFSPFSIFLRPSYQKQLVIAKTVRSRENVCWIGKIGKILLKNTGTLTPLYPEITWELEEKRSWEKVSAAASATRTCLKKLQSDWWIAL